MEKSHRKGRSKSKRQREGAKVKTSPQRREGAKGRKENQSPFTTRLMPLCIATTSKFINKPKRNPVNFR
jgi:hypothetical protein